MPEQPVPVVDVQSAELLVAAQQAQKNAYAPYSQFPVGAAILSGSGKLFVGANVENAAYPEGICAEAGAIGAMVTAGEREIEMIVTVCEGKILGTPCGGCRQKIREFSNPSTVVYAASNNGIERSYSIADLLPDSFGPEQLG